MNSEQNTVDCLSPFSRILLELRMMEVVVTTEAVRRAKFQSNHHHQQTNTHLFYRPDALPASNQQCQSTDDVILTAYLLTTLQLVLFTSFTLTAVYQNKNEEFLSCYFGQIIRIDYHCQGYI